MKSAVLLPYCPLPANTGAKAEMWQHLQVLRQMGECKVLSARRRPVGDGWTNDAVAQFQGAGFNLCFREDSSPGMSGRGMLGMLYACICKALRMEKAFGHANPYHRYAFPEEWWLRETAGADLVFVNYSYYAWLPCKCPKVIHLHDLHSDFMWGGHELETEELKKADLVLVLSVDERNTLKNRGISKTLWIPPMVRQVDTGDSDQIALLGSDSKLNVEGLRWLESAGDLGKFKIRVYGNLADKVTVPDLIRAGRYDDKYEPYRECGIVLMTTVLGMGVQIKGIEALACGKAIIVRKSAMRGLPPDPNAWIEVSTAEDMLAVAKRLQRDGMERKRLSDAARDYYKNHLNSEDTMARLRNAYSELVSPFGDGGPSRLQAKNGGAKSQG